jgi:mRNA interferase MazF
MSPFAAEDVRLISCDNITTVRAQALGDTIGVLFDDQEPDLARAISDAFDMYLA